MEQKTPQLADSPDEMYDLTAVSKRPSGLIPLFLGLMHGGRFDLGLVSVTVNAMQSLQASEVRNALWRHSRGDWSELGPDERRCNEESVAEGGVIASFYTSHAGKNFWIVTEADRSATTVMMPFDY